jgi:hypothetical protein
MKHYANPITGRHKPSPLKADANLIMGEAAMRAAGAVKPIAHSSTEQAAEPVDEPAEIVPPTTVNPGEENGEPTVLTEEQANKANVASLNFMQANPGV